MTHRPADAADRSAAPATATDPAETMRHIAELARSLPAAQRSAECGHAALVGAIAHELGHIAHGDGFYVGDALRTGLVRNQNAIFAGRELKVFFNNFIPNGLVNALRIALPRGMKIDDQQVYAMPQEFR